MPSSTPRLTRGSKVLTPREREIADLVAQGLSNGEIAQQLIIEEGTAANHLQHILRKLDMTSRVQVATWAVEQNARADHDRHLALLGQLRQITAKDLRDALMQAAQAIAEAFAADKSDVFLLDPSTSTLVALGTSQTPMGQKQRSLGLHILPLANGGRDAYVFQTQQPYLDGQVDQDPEEFRGIKVDLGVRSSVAVPLLIAGQPRGVLRLCDARPAYFNARDQQVLEFVAHWVSLVALRFEQPA